MGFAVAIHKISKEISKKEMKRNKRHITTFPWNSGSFIAALLATFYGLNIEAQNMNLAPRLVVNITIDQLRSDYLEHFAPLYGYDGFRKLLEEGRVYEAVSYPFSPVDRASAITCVATGATPQYNKITGMQWLNRSTLRPEYCVSNAKSGTSPDNIACSTISDELKISTGGKAIVFGVAPTRDAAILSAGHAADGAFWMDEKTDTWTTSAYYPMEAHKWINSYKSLTPNAKKGILTNDVVATTAMGCMNDHLMGQDDTTDYLAVTFSARMSEEFRTRGELEKVYTTLDETLGKFIFEVERAVGKDKVLFTLTATGDTSEPKIDYAQYHIPTGNFYINRTAQLLNMYLAAVYGSGKYVESYFKNQIFLNHQIIEDKKLSYSEVLQRSKDLLMMTAGVSKVFDSPYDTSISGDIYIEVAPGWQIFNEDTSESYIANKAFVPFPIIFYGANIKAEHIQTPVTTERIAPTIARCIHIRAPNACEAAPLF